jgi:formylglycine-generating enzyme required for sulfatase activity
MAECARTDITRLHEAVPAIASPDRTNSKVIGGETIGASRLRNPPVLWPMHEAWGSHLPVFGFTSFLERRLALDKTYQVILQPILAVARTLQVWNHPHMARIVTALLILASLPSFAEAQRKTADGGSGRAFRDCAACPEMVVLPTGEFMMGSPESERGRSKNEGPQRKVAITSFAIGKYEVTFAQWDVCVAEGDCKHKAGDEGWGRGTRPVINVSWHDATAFVGWLTRKTGKAYRLPTEAEWEYAARGVTTVDAPHPPFGTGATINYRQANYDANFKYGEGGQPGIFRQKTVTVGTFRKSAFGLHDMHGNVWEWVQDCYRDSYEGAPTDGTAVLAPSCGQRILRGGSWNYQPQLLRSAYRYATAPTVRMDIGGFRVACSL